LKFLLLGNKNILDINIAFLSGINPTYLDLSQNSTRYLDNSVFRKQVQLETLSLSENLLQSLESVIFLVTARTCGFCPFPQTTYQK